MRRIFLLEEPIALSIFRIATALLLIQYGVAKLFKIPAVPSFAKIELVSLLGAAGGLELIFGSLLIVGLFTRFAAFILSGEMAFAYFIGHAPKGIIPLLNNGILAIMLSFACLYLACAGGGRWSIDARKERWGLHSERKKNDGALPQK